MISCCHILLSCIIQMESVPAPPVEEEATIAAPEESETPVQQHPAIMKDEEEPMEQEESDPVIQEEAVDTVPEVRLSYSRCDINDF